MQKKTKKKQKHLNSGIFQLIPLQTSQIALLLSDTATVDSQARYRYHHIQALCSKKHFTKAFEIKRKEDSFQRVQTSVYPPQCVALCAHMYGGHTHSPLVPTHQQWYVWMTDHPTCTCATVHCTYVRTNTIIIKKIYTPIEQWNKQMLFLHFSPFLRHNFLTHPSSLTPCSSKDNVEEFMPSTVIANECVLYIFTYTSIF